MKRITKEQVKTLAERALESGNPYIKQAVKFGIGSKILYKYAGEEMTLDEINAAYIETASKDIRYGYEQRGIGYYDKWYRYNRADEGRAYDLGAALAARTSGCKEEMKIIPCMA